MIHLSLAMTLLCLTLGLAAETSAGVTVPKPASGLVAALRAVVANHPALAGKRANVEAKRYQGDHARAARYPTVKVSAGYLDKENTAGDRDFGTMSFQQPLWAFGKIDRQIAYADEDVLVAEADEQRVRRQLLTDTAVAYARAFGIGERLQVAATDLIKYKRLVTQIKRRHQGQVASDADVFLASARLTQAMAQHDRFLGEQQMAVAELATLTQVPIKTDQPIDAAFFVLPDEGKLRKQAMEEGVDVQFKQRQLALVQADMAREKIGIAPNLSLRADQNLHSYTAGDDSRVMLLLEGHLEGAGVSYVARTGAAHARFKAAEQDLLNTKNDIKRQLDSSFMGLRLQRQQTRAYKNSIAALQKTLASYQRQYETGRKTWLDILNIQRELTEQRLQRAVSENEWRLAALRLVALAGRLDLLLLPPTNTDETP